MEALGESAESPGVAMQNAQSHRSPVGTSKICSEHVCLMATSNFLYLAHELPRSAAACSCYHPTNTTCDCGLYNCNVCTPYIHAISVAQSLSSNGSRGAIQNHPTGPLPEVQVLS